MWHGAAYVCVCATGAAHSAPTLTIGCSALLHLSLLHPQAPCPPPHACMPLPCVFVCPPALRCYNGPQQWQLGWSTLVGSVTSLPTGTWKRWAVPALTTAEAAVVQIRPTWAAAGTYYLSYRMNVGYDSGLSPVYTGVWCGVVWCVLRFAES